MSRISVSWVACTGNRWCPLEKVDLSQVRTTGVYMIWHGGDNPWVVRVGQGDIARRLSAHRSDRSILAYRQEGSLFVTWAAVASQYLDGVERFLAETWNPRVGEKYPDVWPIPVNSPWG